MVKALDLIGSNKQLQNHWLRRLVAIIIDGFILLVIAIIIAVIISIMGFAGLWMLIGHWLWAPLFIGIIWVPYFVILEVAGGATIGKRLVGLIVVSMEGRMNFGKSLIRNISKIHGLFLFIDWLVGFITDGDPRQRLLDRVANTTVVRVDAQEIFIGAYQPPSRPMPEPYSPQAQQRYAPETRPTRYEPGYAAGPEETYEPPAPEEIEPEPMEAREEKVEVAGEEAGEEFTREELVDMKKDELIKIAKNKGLKVSGTKRDLIDRILGEEEEQDIVS